MAEASRALGVPVVSGNVSFYNETEGRAVHPTPSVAMVGVAESIAAHPVAWFREAGDRVLLLGEDRGEFGGSAYLRLLFSASSRGARRRSISRPRRGLATCCGALRWLVSSTPRTTSPKEACWWRSPKPPSPAAWAPASTLAGDPLSLFSETQAQSGDRDGAGERGSACWRWPPRSVCRRARSAWSEEIGSRS